MSVTPQRVTLQHRVGGWCVRVGPHYTPPYVWETAIVNADRLPAVSYNVLHLTRSEFSFNILSLTFNFTAAM